MNGLDGTTVGVLWDDDNDNGVDDAGVVVGSVGRGAGGGRVIGIGSCGAFVGPLGFGVDSSVSCVGEDEGWMTRMVGGVNGAGLDVSLARPLPLVEVVVGPKLSSCGGWGAEPCGVFEPNGSYVSIERHLFVVVGLPESESESSISPATECRYRISKLST